MGRKKTPNEWVTLFDCMKVFYIVLTGKRRYQTVKMLMQF